MKKTKSTKMQAAKTQHRQTTSSFNYKIIVLFILLVSALTNMVLSMYIEQQKTINEFKAKQTTDPCFSDIVEGGCATVQTSIYASSFGFHGFKISNPLVGIYYFSLLAIAFGILLSESQMHKLIINTQSLRSIFLKIILISLIIGSILSAWLLYVQFNILKTTCKYCLWVDAIMLGMTIIYIVTKPYQK